MKEFKKERIIKEALGYFATYGIKSTSMEFIAKMLQISKKTLYQYFHDKQDLLFQCLASEVEQEKRFVGNAIRQQSGLQAIVFLCEHVYQKFCSYSPAFYRDVALCPGCVGLLKREYRQFLFSTSLTLLAWAEQEEDIIPGCDHGMVFEFFENYLSGILRNEECRQESFKHAIYVYMKGIASPQGKEKLENIIKNV